MRKILRMVNILVGVTGQTGIDFKNKNFIEAICGVINDNKTLL